MRFLIVGYGRVGIRTAEVLQSEGHEVVVVDNDPEKVERARRAGLTAHLGEGDDEELLAEAGVTDFSGYNLTPGDPEPTSAQMFDADYRRPG